MPRRSSDQLDVWCDDWGRQRRKAMGINNPKEEREQLRPHERLGKLTCTLGQIREEGEGAGQGGVFNQRFPEVYTGITLDIHRCFHAMPRDWRPVMEAHYVYRSIPIREKAPALNLTPRRYFEKIDLIKAYLAGFLRVEQPSEEHEVA